MARTYQRKFLEDGTLNPKFKPRPKQWKKQPSGKRKSKQSLAEDTLNPAHEPHNSSNRENKRRASQDKLNVLLQKLENRKNSYVLIEHLKHAIRVINRATTSPLRRSALRLYLMTLEVAEKNQSSEVITPTLTELIQCSICPNCEKNLSTEILFCSELCQQEAITVRYCRRVTRDDQRCMKHDVQEGIGIRLLMLLGGGYPAAARKISPELRKQIFERDSYICRICGEPATEIDHINNSSNDIENLRAICKPCNLELALNRAKTVTMENDPDLFISIERYLFNLATRIALPNPIKVCDDEVNWMSIQYHLRSKRKNNKFSAAQNL